MIRKYLDLFIIIFLCAVEIVGNSIGINANLQFAGFGFGLVLALVLPGYVITTALLPELEFFESVLLIFSLSIVVDILTGLFLNFTQWGLQPNSWAILLSSITILFAIIAILKRSRLSQPPEIKFPNITLRTGLLSITTILIIFLAITIAINIANIQATAFSELWAVPKVNGQALSLNIGIRNQENIATKYNLELENGGVRLKSWQEIELKPKETWNIPFILDSLPSKPVRVLLYKSEKPGELYRWVQVAPDSFPVQPPAQ